MYKNLIYRPQTQASTWSEFLLQPLLLITHGVSLLNGQRLVIRTIHFCDQTRFEQMLQGNENLT